MMTPVSRAVPLLPGSRTSSAPFLSRPQPVDAERAVSRMKSSVTCSLAHKPTKKNTFEIEFQTEELKLTIISSW